MEQNLNLERKYSVENLCKFIQVCSYSTVGVEAINPENIKENLLNNENFFSWLKDELESTLIEELVKIDKLSYTEKISILSEMKDYVSRNQNEYKHWEVDTGMNYLLYISAERISELVKEN